ncbi:Uma2 family endonuclease [Anabaena azotica]|uniref:Uma2 family endonuclease n=1 Tax=Anabaena azotica FACHB-119 TaxID=947527 RepID=A0ABR8D0Z0_9NOST|nr:Uma2 family endonuclease [Anabaena azotica]MBD2499433.1 Uma2 family endonuclease [Anabaena azotica FACHB-119]
MVEQVLINADDYSVPDANQLITEDDTPVDNFASARQQRLLVGSLYTSLQDQTFLAEANVGIYHTDGEAAIVPDVFISFDVQTPENWWEKQNRCYLVWKFGKVPEVVIEIVSNKEGEELGKKLRIYEKMRVIYYIVYDPTQQLGDKTLRVYQLNGRYYREIQETWLEQVGLGVTLWTGEFEGRQDNWLRWCHQDGTVLSTGDELAQRERLEKEQAQQLAQQERLEKEQAQQLAQQAQQLAQQERLEKEQAQQLAQQERLEKEQAQQRAQLLAERLLSLGIDPENL